jgi:hypothetical protein
MKEALQIFIIAMIAFSCNSKQEFDSKEWNRKGVDWWMTDVREKMVDDLIQNGTLIGFSKNEVIELLGQPEKNGSPEIQYLIREKYGTDIDPEYISMLTIKFDKKDKAVKCEINK